LNIVLGSGDHGMCRGRCCKGRMSGWLCACMVHTGAAERRRSVADGVMSGGGSDGPGGPGMGGGIP
jgi:hypothetical protein